MRYFIRNLQDGSFYHSSKRWVPSLEEATNVSGEAEALELMDGEDLSQRELFVTFPDGRLLGGFRLSAISNS